MSDSDYRCPSCGLNTVEINGWCPSCDCEWSTGDCQRMPSEEVNLNNVWKGIKTEHPYAIGMTVYPNKDQWLIEVIDAVPNLTDLQPQDFDARGRCRPLSKWLGLQELRDHWTTTDVTKILKDYDDGMDPHVCIGHLRAIVRGSDHEIPCSKPGRWEIMSDVADAALRVANENSDRLKALEEKLEEDGNEFRILEALVLNQSEGIRLLTGRIIAIEVSRFTSELVAVP